MSRRNRAEYRKQEALNRFKYEVANKNWEFLLKQGLQWRLTSYQNGSVGGLWLRK